MDNVKTVYPTTNKVCGGVIIMHYSSFELSDSWKGGFLVLKKVCVWRTGGGAGSPETISLMQKFKDTQSICIIKVSLKSVLVTIWNVLVLLHSQTRWVPIQTATIKTATVTFLKETLIYRNDPKFSDRYAWANSADTDQTAPSLHCLPFCPHRLDSLLYGKAT